MIDRENVIGNLEQNIRWIEESECHQFPGWGNVTMAMRDALELLKEQEPKLVDNIQIRTLDTVGDCPSCGIGVSKRYNPMHCGLCGQAVKWYE